ncbi:uncharacterized protein B0J16DRAFT_159281 [Fusarium flagelliforme]|uniref:uncharacterized protein n=1 Tax=Fusarium flagelliforme TaxID=2675880 RepID=UPI001E8CC849|nr:uncharacterized protein B0J16DRAFT_159281 [Fusarium flagelliforme]KAH7182999.1 hypothetical protein B0J16DRAFT_159281 [Fusarium flagelliforme]
MGISTLLGLLFYKAMQSHVNKLRLLLRILLLFSPAEKGNKLIATAQVGCPFWGSTLQAKPPWSQCPGQSR